MPTVTPLEGGDARDIASFQTFLRALAEANGFRVLMHDAPSVDCLREAGTPTAIHDALRSDGSDFLGLQPSLVLDIGSVSAPPSRTVVVNFHVDTVGPFLPARMESGRLHGRGAADVKAVGVALLLSLAEAYRGDRAMAETTRVVMAAVPGEEGGAMGWYGTRFVVGRLPPASLHIYVEPTGNRFLDNCPATMTARFRVNGASSTDDAPNSGHNATIALSLIAAALVEGPASVAERHGSSLVLGGIHTGYRHNRVYGDGYLLVNAPYSSDHVAAEIADAIESALGTARERLAKQGTGVTQRLRDDWSDVVGIQWMKRGLPVLQNRDTHLEGLLTSAGLSRSVEPLTCDAIWSAGLADYTVVYGPGHVSENGVHASTEWIDLVSVWHYCERVIAVMSALGSAAEKC